MQILPGHEPQTIELAARLLRSGEVVAFPTETVYGLGADALNPYAVSKIFEVKRRPRFDPLIVHVVDFDWVLKVVKRFPPEAERIAKRFWPGPLTIVLEKSTLIPDIVTAGLSTVAVRMPSHEVARRLIRSFGKPIAAPSANPFGYLSPTRAEHVARFFGKRVPLIIDGGNTVYGIESTVIRIEGGKIYVLRLGAITTEELSEFGEVVIDLRGSIKPLSPGQLPYHYAPERPLKIVDGPEGIVNPNSSYLSFMVPSGEVNAKYVRVLSESGDLKEAASRFFSLLIELDRDDVDIIYAQRVPEVGLGRAMMERLRKAEKKSLSVKEVMEKFPK